MIQGRRYLHNYGARDERDAYVVERNAIHMTSNAA